MSRLLRKQAVLIKDIVNRINEHLTHIAFSPQMDTKYPAVKGNQFTKNTKQEKAERGGLTTKEWQAYQQLNQLLHQIVNGSKLPATQALFQSLVDLENDILNKNGNLVDVIQTPLYKKIYNNVMGASGNIRKDIGKLTQDMDQERTDKKQDKERITKQKSDKDAIIVPKKLYDQFKLIRDYHPNEQWWEMIQNAIHTGELINPINGEIITVKTADELYKILNTDDGPIKQALTEKIKSEQVSKLWLKAKDAKTVLAQLTKPQLDWLNSQPDVVYNQSTYKISPISIAIFKHSVDINNWKNDYTQKDKVTLQSHFDKWMNWVKEENAAIQRLNIPTTFVNYISGSNQSWYENTCKIITQAIEIGATIQSYADYLKLPDKTKYIKSLASLQRYIYNSALVSVGLGSLDAYYNIDYKYLADKPKDTTKQASLEFDRIITALFKIAA